MSREGVFPPIFRPTDVQEAFRGHEQTRTGLCCSTPHLQRLPEPCLTSSNTNEGGSSTIFEKRQGWVCQLDWKWQNRQENRSVVLLARVVLRLAFVKDVPIAAVPMAREGDADVPTTENDGDVQIGFADVPAAKDDEDA